mmetsp:Transcript_141326/g.271159  ORF Transcript_141326/g.271159 Transcript_141326/m.271159 type:complete len:698 (-) Transcript_141326:35-2128(-)
MRASFRALTGAGKRESNVSSASDFQTAEEEKAEANAKARRASQRLSGVKARGSKGKGKGKGDGASSDDKRGSTKSDKGRVSGFFGRLSMRGRQSRDQAAQDDEEEKKKAELEKALGREKDEEEEKDSEEGTSESSASADSREEEFTIIERQPAGDCHFQCRLPDSMKEKYVFLELLHDSGQGRRVYLCEDLEWKPKVELNVEQWASPRQKPRKAVRGKLGVEMLEKEIRQQEDKKEFKQVEKAPRRRRCVMKVWQKTARTPEHNEAWLNVQVKLLSMERHPNVVLPRKIWEDEIAYYVDFDAIYQGCNLLQMILSDASLTERQVKRVTRGILRGLNHLHRNHLVHRDIKPDNILLEWGEDALELIAKTGKLPKGHLSSKNGVKQWKSAAPFKSSWTRHELVVGVRIIDCDLVVPFTGPGGQVPIIPGTEPTMADIACPRICGTPGYMAPEAFYTFPGPPGDMFGVGVIIFFMVACDAPMHDRMLRTLRGERFEDADEETLQKLAEQTTYAIEDIDWECHPWDQLPLVRDLCRQLLHIKPGARGGVDAGDVMKTAPWFQRAQAVEVSQFQDLQAIAGKTFAGLEDPDKDSDNADDEMEGDLNMPVVMGRTMRRAGLIEVKEDTPLEKKERRKRERQQNSLSSADQPQMIGKSPRGAPKASPRGGKNSPKASPRGGAKASPRGGAKEAPRAPGASPRVK